MTLTELDSYLRDYLNIAAFPHDPSKNGIQVARSNADSGSPSDAIKKIAFAVDACLETIRRAAVLKADVLFVHHGMFWGECEPVRGPRYERIKALIQNNIALFACHLPLDAHPECGNNYGIARALGMRGIEPFGEWRGHTIGVTGMLPTPLSAAEIIEALFPGAADECVVLPFGKEKLAKIAVISGGASDMIEQAADAGADAFLTGEIKHENYHYVQERRFTVIAAGHYRTETIGVQLARQHIERDTGIETVFIDAPTGL